MPARWIQGTHLWMRPHNIYVARAFSIVLSMAGFVLSFYLVKKSMSSAFRLATECRGVVRLITDKKTGSESLEGYTRFLGCFGHIFGLWRDNFAVL